MKSLRYANIFSAICIIFTIILTGSCAHLLKSGQEKDSTGEICADEDTDAHKICNQYTNWERQITAYDRKGKVYYIFTCKDKIVFLSPYNTLLYSREGHVIGFQKAGVFHFHKPTKGWEKGVDISSVGVIKNKYEGLDDFPDFSSYTTPPSLVKQK